MNTARMNRINQAPFPIELETELARICSHEDLSSQRAYLDELTGRLGIDHLDCAAGLMLLWRRNALRKKKPATEARDGSPLPDRRRFPSRTIRLLRYRLAVGRQHRVTAEELKKVLIEESGVDKNNIGHIEIQEFYTLIELPDEMPHDIFEHLKSVEINQQKLDIRRVKNRRSKKRGHHRHERRRHEPAAVSNTN